MSSTTKEATSSRPTVEKEALVDDEGDITNKFESALIQIFARFSTSYRKRHPDVKPSDSSSSASLPRPDAAEVLTEADLDVFSTVTNGAALSEESKNEIKEFLDTDKDGNLTFRGFVEMYHLQSDNEPEETWKDLEKLGFDDQLEYKGESERKPTEDELKPKPKQAETKDEANKS